MHRPEDVFYTTGVLCPFSGVLTASFSGADTPAGFESGAAIAKPTERGRNRNAPLQKKRHPGECRKPNGPQMLDAAHGLAQRPVIVVQRMDIRRRTPQPAAIGTRGRKGRRRPGVATGADGVQSSRRLVAAARSRRKKQSLE